MELREHSDQDVYKWLHKITGAASLMPEVALLPGERMALSGHLFQEAEPFVRAVAAALSEAPELYRDVPVDPAQLLARQDRAQALRKLLAALEVYAQRAADWLLLEQSAAVREALAVVQQVRADDARPFPPATQRERRDALARAELLLRRRSERRREPRREATEGDERELGAPGERRRGQATPGAAQRRAAAEYARALREREAERLGRALTRPHAAPAAPAATSCARRGHDASSRAPTPGAPPEAPAAAAPPLPSRPRGTPETPVPPGAPVVAATTSAPPLPSPPRATPEAPAPPGPPEVAATASAAPASPAASAIAGAPLPLAAQAPGWTSGALRLLLRRLRAPLERRGAQQRRQTR